MNIKKTAIIATASVLGIFAVGLSASIYTATQFDPEDAIFNTSEKMSYESCRTNARISLMAARINPKVTGNLFEQAEQYERNFKSHEHLIHETWNEAKQTGMIVYRNHYVQTTILCEDGMQLRTDNYNLGDPEQTKG